MLVHHPQQLALYAVEGAKREAVWSPHAGSVFRRQQISAATFSADGNQVVAAFSEGDLGIMDGVTLKPLCRIALSVLDPAAALRPTALAAQPLPGGVSRIAVGCSNSKVVLLEAGGAASWAPIGSSAAAESKPEAAPAAAASGGAQERSQSPAADAEEAAANGAGASGAGAALAAALAPQYRAPKGAGGGS